MMLVYTLFWVLMSIISICSVFSIKLTLFMHIITFPAVIGATYFAAKGIATVTKQGIMLIRGK